VKTSAGKQTSEPRKKEKAEINIVLLKKKKTSLYAV